MDSSERRKKVLEAAARLFEHYGHGKTTIADVAREAHVGVGSVYLEFDSKDAIVSELSLSTHISVLDAMRTASKKYVDPAQRLMAVLVARTECFLRLRQKGQHACDLIHCPSDAVRDAHEQFREQERALFEVLVQEGQRVGAFTLHEPGATAVAIQHAFSFLAPPWLSIEENEATRICIDLCELLLNGLVTANRRSSALTDDASPSTGLVQGETRTGRREHGATKKRDGRDGGMAPPARKPLRRP